MAKAYWVTTYRNISNPDALAEYAKLAAPAIQAGGGRFLVRGTPSKVYEAGLNQRTVIIEFDSVAARWRRMTATATRPRSKRSAMRPSAISASSKAPRRALRHLPPALRIRPRRSKARVAAVRRRAPASNCEMVPII
jgi:Uncharacterized conserved protein